MLGRSCFRLLLLFYPSWFRNRFGVEMLAEFDASRARSLTRRERVTFWLRIIWDASMTVPQAWWHSLSGLPKTQRSHTERKRHVVDDLTKDIQLLLPQ